VFECFHNFVALSQWGNSIFGIMTRLSEDGGDPAVRASFQTTDGTELHTSGLIQIKGCPSRVIFVDLACPEYIPYPVHIGPTSSTFRGVYRRGP